MHKYCLFPVVAISLLVSIVADGVHVIQCGPGKKEVSKKTTQRLDGVKKPKMKKIPEDIRRISDKFFTYVETKKTITAAQAYYQQLTMELMGGGKAEASDIQKIENAKYYLEHMVDKDTSHIRTVKYVKWPRVS